MLMLQGYASPGEARVRVMRQRMLCVDANCAYVRLLESANGRAS